MYPLHHTPKRFLREGVWGNRSAVAAVRQSDGAEVHFGTAGACATTMPKCGRTFFLKSLLPQRPPVPSLAKGNTMNPTILTLDAGTTGLKCSVIDREGRVLSEAVSAYGINYPASGWAEQPAEWFINACRNAVRRVLPGVNSHDIAAIGLTGTMNGLIPVDENGDALFPNIIHADTRAVAELDDIRAVISEKDYYQRTGNRLDVHFSLPKLLWLKKNRPAVYQKARWFVQTKDALYGFLTGRPGLSDFSDAGLTGAVCIEKGIFDRELLQSLSLDPEKMPELLRSDDVSGKLNERAAGLLGLPAGIPVSAGGGDGAAATLGAGLFNEDGAYCNIGSSAWVAKLSKRPVIDEGKRIHNYASMDGGHFTICGTVQSGAASLEWAAENLVLASRPFDRAGILEMEKLARESVPGARGVFFLPTLVGERTPWWDPHARGTLIGVSLHHTRADIARAAYEGVCEAMLLCGGVLRENGLALDRLVLIGGGAESGVWPQMFADLFGAPVAVHRSPRNATALGAAMAAGVGVGLFRDYREAAKMARVGEAVIPEGDRERYRRHYEVYKMLYGELKGAYRRIYWYQNEG